MAGYVGTKAVLLSTTAANVGGDADIGGDLTVDTSTLHVDSTNNRVGVGTILPSDVLHVSGGSSTDGILIQNPLSGSFYNAKLEFTRDNTSGGAKIQSERNSAGGVGLSFNYTSSNANEVSGTYSEAMRIDSSGNVGINGTPSASDGVFKLIQIGGSNKYATFGAQANGGFAALMGSNFYYNGGWKRTDAGRVTKIETGPDSSSEELFSFQYAGDGSADSAISWSEAMRIDSAGVLIVGNTSSTSQSGTVDAKGYKGNAGVGGAKGNAFNVYWTGSSPQLWIDTTNVGTISVSSDYRIKRNVETQTDEALSRVMQLRPVTYQMADYEDLFNASDDIKEGFIAHEVSEIIPSAVEGEKDCSDQIQSLKLDAIVSVLTKALQEQQVLIETLRADLAALQEAPDEITDLKARVATLEAN